MAAGSDCFKSKRKLAHAARCVLGKPPPPTPPTPRAFQICERPVGYEPRNKRLVSLRGVSHGTP